MPTSVLLSWCIVCLLMFTWNKASDMPWKQRQTVVTSLKKNIVGKCRFTMGKQLNDTFTEEDTFMVIAATPARYERKRHFNGTFTTWTHGNKELSTYFIEKGLGFNGLGQETGIKWMMHSEHPGQNRNMCIALTLPVGQGEPSDIYSNLRRDTYRLPYVVRKRHAVIHPQGFVMSDCGYFQGYEGCETRHRNVVDKIYKLCSSQLNRLGMTFESYFGRKSSKSPATFAEKVQQMIFGNTGKEFKESNYIRVLKSCVVDDTSSPKLSDPLFKPKFYKRVFVIDALWDINYHHFLVDSLSRLARYIDFLRSNPDIYIHIRGYEYKLYACSDHSTSCVNDGVVMRNRIFQLLGIDLTRIVYGTVIAEEVFIPRVPACGFALGSSLDIRLQGDLILAVAIDAAPEYARKQLKMNKRNLIIQQRFSDKRMLRYWNDSDTETIETNFAKQFPKHNIIRHSSKNIRDANYCFACDVIDYANADILVGIHGAGLTNMIFMPPGGVVVEIFGDALDLYMTLCGYFGPLAASVGHSHYMHSFRYDEGKKFDSASCAQDLKQFYINYVKRSSIDRT